jgi:hypothetical protein
MGSYRGMGRVKAKKLLEHLHFATQGIHAYDSPRHKEISEVFKEAVTENNQDDRKEMKNVFRSYKISLLDYSWKYLVLQNKIHIFLRNMEIFYAKDVIQWLLKQGIPKDHIKLEKYDPSRDEIINGYYEKVKGG